MVPVPLAVKAENNKGGSEKRDYRNWGGVVAVCEHRGCVFHIYRKARMRQPSEPERAPLQEGLTQPTVIVGRNNDLTRLCRTFSYVVMTLFPLPQRAVIVVWHVASSLEPC